MFIEKLINGINYVRWDNGGPSIWKPVETGELPYICSACLGTNFEVFSPEDYSTHARCVTCFNEDEIHSG